jgi:gliding motility-associated-like protein
LWNTIPPQVTANAVNLAGGTWTVTVTDIKGCIVVAQGTVSQPPPMNVSVTSADITCHGANDGQASVTVSGGSSPFSYTWNTVPAQNTSSVSNLPPGTFTVTITDAGGCQTTATVTIIEPPLLSAGTTSTPESCTGLANGTATVTPSGGTGAYGITWNTVPVQTTLTATGLASGSYTVTVTDANGCSVVASVNVAVLNDLSASAVAIDATCFGDTDGSVDASVSGGTTPYGFTWSNGGTGEDLAGVGAGTYTLTVTDDVGCQAVASATVNEPPQVTVSLGVDRTIEQGHSVTLTANVTPPGTYSYTWNPTSDLDDPTSGSPVATPQATTTYTLIVTDANGCSATDDITIEVIPPTDLTLPSAFTPDGDGLNDVFFEALPLDVEIVRLDIYNRWGELIHTGDQPWDGTVNGVRQPIGAYMYQVTVRFVGTSITLPLHGNVTLLR